MLSQISQEDYRRVKEILGGALDLAPDERAGFLRAACAGDDNLRLEIESLLAAGEDAGAFLESFSAARVVQDLFDKNKNLIGQSIDKYRLEKEIGRGGMGVVFLATREDFHQRAAIKLIKRGMDSDAVLERFNREREILAALNHPFIARLTDGGTTADNLPYFVMEYVEGISVDEFCEANELSEKETLELFRRICEAVAFAHQKLVVHRDLKPSNILVCADGTPKLLDFGIAKLLDSTDANDTQTNQRVLTPAYASPEQLRGEPFDTTSDVYSLGLILCEMLGAESSKFKVQSRKSKVQSLKTEDPRPKSEVQSGEPDKSSKSEVQSPATIQNPKSRIQNPNGDLRNILATALREDAARRYGSVEKFSDDVRRYLGGLPVSARKDTFSYRAAKFVQRNRLAVGAAILLVLTLAGGLAATLWQWREAEREREIAERRFDNLRKVSGSFVTEIHGAIENLPGSLRARQLLLRHATEQLDALAKESGDNPALQDELAQAYANSADLPDMLLAEKDATLRNEIAIYRNLIAAEPKNTHYRQQLAFGEIALGDITKVRGSVAGALELEKNGVALLEQIVESEPENVASRLALCDAYLEIAVIYILKRDAAGALQTNRRILAEVEQLRKMNAAESDLNRITDQAQIQLGTEETLGGNYKAAIDQLRPVLAVYQTRRAENPNDTSINYYYWGINRRLAAALKGNGEIEEAAERTQAALSTIENLLAQSPKDLGYHRNSAITHILYGEILVRRKRAAAALEHFRRALELSAQVLESDADNVESRIDSAKAYADLGNALMLTGKNKEGSDSLAKAVKMFAEIKLIDSANAELEHDFNQARDWLNAASNENPA